MQRYVFALAGFVLFFLPPAAFAVDPPGRYQGTLGESAYLINVPPDWNGGLVLFAHGYQGEGAGKGTVQSEPLDDHLTKRGYAWAASGYRAWGYRPDWFLLDLLALRAHFINRFGQPRWTVIHGKSMGGHISIASLELYRGVYQGALIEGGVIDGVGLADWFYSYTAAAQYFSDLPLLDTPSPEFDHLVYTKWLAAMGEPGSTRTVAGDLTALSNTSPGVMSRFGLKVWHCGISRTFLRVIPDRHTPANWRVMRNTRRIQYNI